MGIDRCFCYVGVLMFWFPPILRIYFDVSFSLWCRFFVLFFFLVCFLFFVSFCSLFDFFPPSLFFFRVFSCFFRVFFSYDVVFRFTFIFLLLCSV